MIDVDREAIELGIASIGEFDIDNCTCDASVGFYPCHYCAEREAILAGKRVLERLAAAQTCNDDLTIMNQDLVIYRDQQEARLAAAEAELKLRTAELAACKSACQGEMESADEYKAERDECRRLLQEACDECHVVDFDYTKGNPIRRHSHNGALLVEDWFERAAKAGGGV